MNTDGTATIWASDYDIGGFDNCSEVKFFFLNDEGIASPSYIFTCNDIPNGISTVKQLELFISDEAGNISSCNISIAISDNNNICPDSAVGAASISGVVMTKEGEMIEDVRVSLNGRDNDVTDVNGAYAFANVPMESSYRIQGFKNVDHLNGVSTLDLVLIQRHILALESFDEAPNLIAADVNDDGRVSALDLVHIRRLILGLTNVFEENSSWRFLDPNQEFMNPTQPFPFVDEILINNLVGDMVDQDLLGVKIGDVSGNAIANSLSAGNRSANIVDLEATNQKVQKDDIVRVPLNLTQIDELVSLQLSLKARNAEILSIEGIDIALEESHIRHIDNQQVSIAWWSPETVEATEIIVLRAHADGSIKDMISIDQSVLDAAVYDATFEEYDLKIDFQEGGKTVDTYQLYQNVPNPFSGSTAIAFDLVEAGEVTLTVWDISGRSLFSVTERYDKGHQQLIISNDDINTSGLLYYQLKTRDFAATKKMILID